MIDVTIIPVLADNYAYLLQSPDGATAIVDPGEAGPVIDVLESRNLKLDFIFNTHHHWDHTDGNMELKQRYSAKIAAPAAEIKQIPGADIGLSENMPFAFGGEEIRIIETPGHTAGHICFHLPDSGIVFTGDTLFVMGCGKLFEGTAAQMWNSLQKLMALPDETLIYCGHEYALPCGRFCMRIEPDNDDLKQRLQDIRKLRDHGKPSVPAPLWLEKKTNAYLRVKDAVEFAKIRK